MFRVQSSKLTTMILLIILVKFQNRHLTLRSAGFSENSSNSSFRLLWFQRCQGLGNLFLEVPNQYVVFIGSGFGLRLFGLGPVPKCIDAGIVVFTQVEKLGNFLYKKIDGMFFIRKSLSNMTCFVIHSSSSQSGFLN